MKTTHFISNQDTRVMSRFKIIGKRQRINDAFPLIKYDEAGDAYAWHGATDTLHKLTDNAYGAEEWARKNIKNKRVKL